LENKLDKPRKGWRRLHCGASGVVLKIQPPDASAPDTTAKSVTAANKAQASTAGSASVCRRSIIICGADKAAASNTKACRSPRSKYPNSQGAKHHSSAAPKASTNKCPTSRERATCPSVRAFSRRRAVAGRCLS